MASNVPAPTTSKPRAGARQFLKKYFWEGQKLGDKQQEALKTLPEDASVWTKILVKHRLLVGILIPLLFFEILWWLLAIRHNYFEYFPSRYLLTITMIFGSTIAGMTSEGGGAVAFPVMTLALNITPHVARDFSLMIQSCGMAAASFTILWMKIKLEKHSLLFCSMGAVGGMVLGLEVVDSLLSSHEKKLGFVCIWFSFAFALFLLNREHKRKTFDEIQNFGVWQAGLLVMMGFLGGIFSAVAGSGVDICSFSLLTLLFRVSEKVATPTSIVLMAINATFGFYWRQMMTDNGVEMDAWGYLIVCVPVVVVFAPMGSLVASHFHRQVLAAMVYILDALALITAFIVIPLDLHLGIMSGSFLLGGFVLFFLMSKAGQWLATSYEKRSAISQP